MCSFRSLFFDTTNRTNVLKKGKKNQRSDDKELGTFCLLYINILSECYTEISTKPYNVRRWGHKAT